MPWKRTRDPKAPPEPAFHHPLRCMNCGHLQDQHDVDVGCLVEGGTKYIEDHTGSGVYACSCEAFVPAPENPSTSTPEGASQ